MIDHNPIPPVEREHLVGMAISLDPDDRVCLLELLRGRQIYRVVCHFLEEDRPPEGIGEWERTPYGLSEVARFWFLVADDEYTTERLLEIHDEMIEESEAKEG